MFKKCVRDYGGFAIFVIVLTSLILAVAFFPCPTRADEVPVALEYRWSPPTEGGLVLHYEGQRRSWRIGEPDTNYTIIGDFPDTMLIMEYSEGFGVQVRVRAWGKMQTFSGWGGWSLPFDGSQSYVPGIPQELELFRIIMGESSKAIRRKR